MSDFFIALPLSMLFSLGGLGGAYAESAPPIAEDSVISEEGNVPPALTLDESEALSEAKASGVPAEVESMTTEDSVTRALPDGTFQAELSTAPVRVKDAAGWHRIDTNLTQVVKDGQPRLKPSRALADVSLSRGGSDVMAYLGDHKGAAVTQRWPFGVLPEPEVEDNKATYREVLPGVDLVQMVQASGVSQVLTVKNRAALEDPRVVQMRFLLHADGATVRDRGDGRGLAAVTASGETALETAEGQWWDSSWEDATAESPGGPGLSYPLGLSLGTENGQQVQKLGIDSILSSKKLTFPVFIDPDWSTGETGYTYIDDQFPSVSYYKGTGGSDGNVHVGFLPAAWDNIYWRNHVTRGFYQFDTAFLSGKKIIKAVMSTTEIYSSSCTARPVSAYATTSIGPGTTWNNSPVWGTKFSTVTVAKGHSSSCPGDKVGFDMGAAKTALSTDSQWTVGLRADDETDELGWKQFSKDATMVVTYDTPPTTPTIKKGLLRE